ncbi:hypothetical protein CGLO_00309 [Colletotrichum gloeosporioides Cg-14]|uniref:Class 5 chitinase chi100 n=1 Tax=Colletotrichum gloeosporioides (strain Cg-14) TaxID=1237896 RepID=T0ME54_COLGC|nr:hypothetical protein CGLO_00309 [Colletotrichum gloeosporioides Cg-14]
MFFSSFTLLLASATAATAQALVPAAPPAPIGKVDWRAVNCSGVIVDAKALPDKRWEAAGASDALHEVFAAWRNYTTGPDEVKFQFSEFVSWYFGGPEEWHCKEIFDVPCSTTLVCEDTKYPAGHLILNSFSKLHRFHHRYFEALSLAQQDIQSEMDLFAESFSVPPPRDESKDQTKRILLNVAYGVIGIAQAYMNNFFIFAKPVEQAAGQMISQVWRSQLTTTLSYSIFTGWAIGKDYMLPGKDPKVQYGSLGAMMGDVFDSWKATQTAYVDNIFSPNNTETENFLIAALDNGLMGATPDDLNAYEMSRMVQKLFYPRFMVSIWQTRKWSKRPFVLKTNLPCKMATGERDSSLWPFLPDSDHARAAACYEDRLFYLVDIRSEGVKLTTEYPSIRPNIFKSKHWPLTALFGTETMDGSRYGGVTKEDIVAAAYGGWVEGGYKNNVYQPNYTDVSPQAQAKLWSDQGNRSPGFVNMTLCQNIYTIVGNVVHGKPEQNPSWPCAPLSEIKPLPPA